MTNKQKAFVDEYLIDLNATRAYKEVYRSVKSDDVAAKAGSRLLRNVEVEEYLNKRIMEREARQEVKQDRVLKELSNMIDLDVTEIVSIDSDTVIVKDTSCLTAEQKKCIKSIKQTRDGIEIQFYDKMKALELLGRHLGMFTDKVEHSGNINNPFANLSEEQLLEIVKTQ